MKVTNMLLRTADLREISVALKLRAASLQRASQLLTRTDSATTYAAGKAQHLRDVATTLDELILTATQQKQSVVFATAQSEERPNA